MCAVRTSSFSAGAVMADLTRWADLSRLWALAAASVLAVAVAVGVGGCAAPSKPGPEPRPSVQAAPAPAQPASAPDEVAARTPPVEVPATPASPPTPAPVRVDARAAMEQVRLQLNLGHEEEALAHVKSVLDTDPDNKAALGFLRQIKEDPVVLYGKVFQSYRVEPGDTMALIAQRGMGDRDQFFGLARYNGIKVPKDLKVGQVIKVPGRRALVQPAPPASAVTEVVSPSPAPQPTPPAPPPPDPKVAERKRLADIQKFTKEANVAMAKQDVCSAIKAWDAVLALDAQNSKASLERGRALELKARLPNAKC